MRALLLCESVPDREEFANKIEHCLCAGEPDSRLMEELKEHTAYVDTTYYDDVSACYMHYLCYCPLRDKLYFRMGSIDSDHITQEAANDGFIPIMSWSSILDEVADDLDLGPCVNEYHVRPEDEFDPLCTATHVLKLMADYIRNPEDSTVWNDFVRHYVQLRGRLIAVE